MSNITRGQFGLIIFIIIVIVTMVTLFIYYVFTNDDSSSGGGGGTGGANYNPNIQYINQALSTVFNTSQNPTWYSPPALPNI